MAEYGVHMVAQVKPTMGKVGKLKKKKNKLGKYKYGRHSKKRRYITSDKCYVVTLICNYFFRMKSFSASVALEALTHFKC